MADKESESKVPAKDIHQILQQLALAQAAPDSKKPAKKQEDYKFWNTQPVPKFQEPNLLQTTDGGAESLPEGPILPAKLCVASAKDTPEPLVDGFVWTDLDLNDNAEMNELYDLLFNHYVEDTDGSFRFNYSIPFLNWALKPPGWRKEWHVGVRTKTGEEGKKGKLVAFISAVPAKLDVRKNELEIVEINFLSIHRKLRAKRLTPVLIKEITRRCYRIGIYQALYTAGALLPTPVSTCRYFHRSLDWRHLYKNKFSALPPRTTEQQQIRKYFLTSTTSTKGLRPMKSSDVPAVSELLRRYLARFQLSQHFTNDELEHCLVSSAAKDVVWSYVVEDKGNITDFFSYYVLESTVLKANERAYIRAAYLYYYASEAAFDETAKSDSKVKQDGNKALEIRLNELMHDALILAKNDGFHVFNALSLLDNPLFVKQQKFEPGDGRLHFYLFNWRMAKVPSGLNAADMPDATQMGGVGVVML